MSGRLILVRHGQSFGNVERRLDTRPPGTELTPLGRDQARAFARRSGRPAMLAHAAATRALQTAAVIGGEVEVPPIEVAGVHEVQVGRLENRNDDDAVAEFNAIYERWHHGELDVALPGGETGNDVLDRYMPVLTDLRLRYLDNHDFHGDIVLVSHGAAIRLAAAVLAGVEAEFAHRCDERVQSRDIHRVLIQLRSVFFQEARQPQPTHTLLAQCPQRLD